ncbi:MAG: hypothetical protein M1337_08945 [Actinobacteria bacterium]|nr:hypothetical protein [Actinomycetota bacterium]
MQVKADELPRVAEALGVSPADFFAEGPPTGAVPTAEALIQRAADLAVERVRGEIAEEVKAAVQNAIRRVVDVAAEGETEAANSTFGPSTYWPEGDSPEDAARETLIEGMFTEDERDLVRAIFRLRGKRRSGGTRPESLTERESETNSA